jgi:hypothetical protein
MTDDTKKPQQTYRIGPAGGNVRYHLIASISLLQ